MDPRIECPKLDRPARYEIKVPGRLEEHWSEWLEGMAVQVESREHAPTITTLTGEVADQAALQGLLNRAYTAHTRVNLFQVGPLYAFSRVTALTAVGLVIPPYVFVSLIPGALFDPITFTYMLLITGVALAAFIWPLLGIHRLLSEEKAHLLDENSLHIEAAIARLRQRAGDGELEQLGSLNTALGTLQSERALLNGIPTWPWQNETVRMLFTALGVPLGLWMAQYLLQRVLGP